LDTPAETRGSTPQRVPPELVNIGGTAAALLAVVAAGAGLSEIAPATVWFTAASYGAPAGVAFLIYCWVTRRKS
jgi:hypothetical protein